ncbi:winged helix-turn-helix domain-containing protein [Serratia ureilytica]|uniref:winged helix-turn-helix domain-containing protein n=1 Tax=Serratia ureilytica TaxID=300181 RepID=UPI001E480481|nr:winged helix-turn-helix domain-containing protein [Serratia ureilytica]
MNDTLEPIVLSATLCRVLALLVKNNNLLLSRDFILSGAWDEYGKKSSHSNLNNYISMLRKIFSTLGEDDIIVTAPREGFLFKAGEVHTLDGESSSVVLSSEDLPSLPISEDLQPIPISEDLQPIPINDARQSGGYRKWLISGGVLLTIVILMVICYLSISKNMMVQTNLGKIDKCSIIALSDPKITNISIEVREVDRLIDRLGLNCSSLATIYHFNSDMSTTHKDLGDTNIISYLSFCPNARPHGFEPKCENFYEVIKKN